jgi:hypothetical protein
MRRADDPSPRPLTLSTATIFYRHYLPFPVCTRAAPRPQAPPTHQADYQNKLRERAMRHRFWRRILCTLSSTAAHRRGADGARPFRLQVEALEKMVLLNGVTFLPALLLGGQPLASHQASTGTPFG